MPVNFGLKILTVFMQFLFQLNESKKEQTCVNITAEMNRTGDMAIITSVSFQPFANAMISPITKVEMNWSPVATFSLIPSFTLLVSLLYLIVLSL
jgi:hypothetical protein